MMNEAMLLVFGMALGIAGVSVLVGVLIHYYDKSKKDGT